VRLLARADASAHGGFGHVVRTLAVLEQARARGHQVLLVGDVPDGWVIGELDRLGIEHRRAVPAWHELAEVAAEWGAHAVHVDDYEAPADLVDGLRAAGVLLVNVEDGSWGRRPADVVMDQTWGAEREDRPDDGTAVLLRGGDQVLVRSTVRRARLARAARSRTASGAASSQALQVVVVMGGSDATSALERVVDAVVGLGLPLSVLAVGTASTDHAALVARSSQEVAVQSCGPRPDLPELMAGADVVVSAAGTTAGELCCIGTPSALLAVVDNQRQVLTAMDRAGVAVALGTPEELPSTASALRPLLASADERARLSARALATVDGCGGARLLGAVEQLVADRAARVGEGSVLHAREALREDGGLLLRWRNDETVRRASRQQGVVEPEGHQRWLAAVLADPDRWLLLVEDAADTPAATVRWDREPEGQQDEASRNTWEVSITLAPDQRGRRLSGAVLAEAEHWLADQEPHARTAWASVHVDNPASLALFRAAGYQPQRGADEQGFERFSRPLRRRPR
jgi:spore coat polysaccharide biosynthesis predicted glycosyltransferase SpsG/RimJ/RimL family protein N-acetyltransferase